ncbi:MAG TPA: hypothetical protein VFW74_18040 [Acidimicrobiia bacterium]|nr:hypothetical protein [Acidimicrobiia bacterium]
MGGREVARRPLVSRTSLLVGLAVALGAGVVLVVAALTSGRVHMLQSDGASFAAIARDPFGNASTLHGFMHGRWGIDGTAYRFGRVTLPLLAWLLALGQPSATVVTLPVVVALSWGAAVAAACELCIRRERRVALGLVVLATPYTYIWVRTPHLVSESLVLALVLFSYLSWTDDRRGLARVLAAVTVLAREVTVLAFVPLVWRDFRERGRAALRDWTIVLLPYVVWCAWLRVRVGTFPFTDPAPSRRDALTLPFVGIARMYRGHVPAGPLVALAGALAALVLAWYVVRERRWFPVRDGAVWMAVAVPCLGTSVWSLWAEAMRVVSVTQSLLLLALVAGVRVTRRARDQAAVA